MEKKRYPTLQPSPPGSPVEMEEILRCNTKEMLGARFHNVAINESIGGNAGRNCLAVNMRLDESTGRILEIGNQAQTNLTVRIYMPLAIPTSSKKREPMIIQILVRGPLPRWVLERLEKSSWLWNIHQMRNDADVVEAFLAGRIREPELDELLGARYPARAVVQMSAGGD